MNFLHQIITASHVYTLYEEERNVFLQVLNLRTEESTDVSGVTIVMDVLNVLIIELNHIMLLY